MQNESLQKLIYLYDLPKDKCTSVEIEKAFQKYAGISLDVQPQIKRDVLTRPFYTAIVSIKDAAQFEIACKKMRYFDIDDKPCRALPFDKQILGSNREKLYPQNVFVKFSKDSKIQNSELHKIFEQFGEIKSVKASINEDYSSRGYGFVCYQDVLSARNAVQNKPSDFEVCEFKPKDVKYAQRKLINNIYIKNIPHDWTDAQVKSMFEPFGNIKSCVLQSNQIGKFGFVCYDDPVNKEYGPECAQKAIDALNGRDIEGSELKLVVKHALSKQDRAVEKQRETIRYKQSKKRCNLYVKNFPNTWNDKILHDIFKQYGDIEKIRLGQGTGNSYAFVCFKEPNDAANAKNNLHNQTFEGKTLMINYYEMKEKRQINNEAAIDKADWEKYTAQNKGGLNWNDLTSQPHLAQMLQSLLQIIQTNELTHAQMNQADRYQRHGGGRRPYNQNRNHNQNYQNNQMQNQIPQHQNNQQMHMNQQRMPQAQQPTMIPQPVAPMPPMAPNGMPMIPPQNIQQMSIQQKYVMLTSKVIPAVSEKNPYLKDQVGQVIFDFIVGIIGPEKAPKITGMLIELPPQQIKQYLMSYDALYMKVQEANEHLVKSNETPQQKLI